MFPYTVILLNLLLYSNNCLADEALSPPDIYNPSASSKLLKEESATFRITCNATGLPKPQYSWKKGEIGGNITLSSYVSFDSITGVLTFQRVSKAEEGEYRCYATNFFNGSRGQSFAVSISPPMIVKMIRVDSILEESKNIVISEYRYTKVPCQHVIVDRKYVIFYWMAGPKSKPIFSNERMFIDKYGNLHITYVLREDMELGELLCGVYVRDNVFGKIFPGQDYFLKITEINQVETIAPKIEYSENVMEELNQSALLECVFSGYDPENNMTIAWFSRDGKEIKTNKKYELKYGNRALEIKNLVDEDEGKYFCKAKLGSKTSKETVVYLDVTGEPHFDKNKAPKDVTVSQGKDVTVPCKAKSSINDDPPSPPLWFINGQNIEFQKVPIHVVSKPDSEQVINPEVGSILNFTVLATTDITQNLSYRWIYRSSIADLVGKVPTFTYSDRETNFAYIDTTDMKEKDYEAVVGFYTLNISNDYDYVIVKTRVRLQLQRQSEP
uniref:Ig-like domain-containing protein n=1 Tax=Biomphalaria glabrata TaxID=6526 RepID=A0A2C9KRB1_BIOGL